MQSDARQKSLARRGTQNIPVNVVKLQSRSALFANLVEYLQKQHINAIFGNKYFTDSLIFSLRILKRLGTCGVTYDMIRLHLI